MNLILLTDTKCISDASACVDRETNQRRGQNLKKQGGWVYNSLNILLFCKEDVANVYYNI